jgi:3-hydroxyacyl-CoA dehydrogenase
MTIPAVKRVAVVGTGVVGSGWAALFLARGLDVVVYDPAQAARERLRDTIKTAWPTLTALGLAEGASQQRLTWAASVADAVRDAQFVQENGPEAADVKQALFREMDAAAPGNVPIASSSSGLLPSDIQAMCSVHPERVLVGHPFHPVYLVPLVEVVPGSKTDAAAAGAAREFYASIGKKPILVRREVPGHVTNRLQAALWREAYSLVERGVASVADIDTAVTNGPGLRWALIGPLAGQHLAGGAGGMAHTLEHLGPPAQQWMDDLRTPQLTPHLIDLLVAGVDAELGSIDQARMVAARDAILVELLQRKLAQTDLP